MKAVKNKGGDPKRVKLKNRINEMMNRIREKAEAGDITSEEFSGLISSLANNSHTLSQGCSAASCDRVEENLNKFETTHFPDPIDNTPVESAPVESAPVNPVRVVKEDPVRPVRVVKEDPVAAPPKREVPQPKGRQPEVQYESNPNMKTGQSPLNMKVWDAKRKQWTTTPLEGGYRERYIQENRIQS